MTCAHHPAIRPTAKIDVPRSAGIPRNVYVVAAVVVDVHDVHLLGRGGRHRRPLFRDLRGELLLDLEVLRAFPGLREVLGEPAQMRRPRVERLVHAVAEPGELVLARDRPLDPRRDVRGRPDLIEHLHRPVGRAAVERTLQRAERRGHRGVQVRVRRRGHPRDERRRVQAMLGLEDEARVQDRRRARVLLIAPGHLGEVRGVPERGVRRDRLLALPPADVVREDRRHLRDQANGLLVLGLGRVVAFERILEARRAHDRAEHVHR